MKKNVFELKRLSELCLKESDYYLNSVDLIAASNFLRPDLANLKEYRIHRSMEGILGKRPYAGTKYLDMIEEIAVESAKRLFDAEYVNVQCHSGSQANQAAYMAFLNPGDKILSLKFDAGGHLTHGNPINYSGKIYTFDYYGINARTQEIDYAELNLKAKKFKPKMIVAGASSYPRIIDYAKIREIADKVGAFFMVDIAHPAGLIAAGLYPSPIYFADVVTSTTEKTLWGPHAGLIFAKKLHAKRIDRAVHPGTQSSVPIDRIVQIAKALLFAESVKFKKYAQSVLDNAKTLEQIFSKLPCCVLFGGTDSHFIVIDVKKAFNLTGKQAEKILEELSIFTNRQVIPWDKNRAYEASGLRIDVVSATARGFSRNDFKMLGEIMVKVLSNPDDIKIKNLARNKINIMIKKINSKKPLY
jgi:glycine hydroxymethyltransferase